MAYNPYNYNEIQGINVMRDYNWGILSIPKDQAFQNKRPGSHVKDGGIIYYTKQKRLGEYMSLTPDNRQR